MEDSSPLEGSTVHDLTSATMTELGIQWFLASQGICDSSAFALGAPLDWTEFLGALNLIWSTMFPGLVFEGVFVMIVVECGGRQGLSRLERAHFGHCDESELGYRSIQGLSQWPCRLEEVLVFLC